MPAQLDQDEELLEALRRREPTAGERLVVRYGDRAYPPGCTERVAPNES